MLLDLREIIELPGGRLSFECGPDLSKAVSGSITAINYPVHAKGQVSNSAGLLTLTCELTGTCVCACARCLKQFERPIDMTIKTGITKGGEGADSDAYALQGDKIDLTEIIVTELILNTDEKLLCTDACAGICQRCGADLNDGSCGCKKEIDPRLSVLGQLLD